MTHHTWYIQKLHNETGLKNFDMRYIYTRDVGCATFYGAFCSGKKT